MAQRWRKPVYTFRKHGKMIEIDVTTSISPSLPPHKVLTEEIIPQWKQQGVERVVDFGAGALRHTFPLLRKGFEVCAVEFQRAFERPKAKEALKKAQRNANFSALIWPHEFIKDRRKFDAALFCFVLQTMPDPAERRAAVKYVAKRLTKDGFLLHMSRYGQVTASMKHHRVSDGYYMWPARDMHSFYREFTTEETHCFFESFGFRRVRSLSARGTEQVFVYGRGKSGWI